MPAACYVSEKTTKHHLFKEVFLPGHCGLYTVSGIIWLR